MTKGHLHAWRPAAEFLLRPSGEGVMLLEDEAPGELRMAPLAPNRAVYVPGARPPHDERRPGAADHISRVPARAATTTAPLRKGLPLPGRGARRASALLERGAS